MRNVSRGGAFLETAPMPFGEEIRVEIEGQHSSFTMDAVVTRTRVGIDGSVGIHFVDRNGTRYAKWLRDECVRLSLWMSSDTVPLAAASDAVAPPAQDDPAAVPVSAVLRLIKAQPGTTISDLLDLESFDEMYVRIAVARLIESRAVTVAKPRAGKEVAAPTPFRLMRRFRRST
jgi:hypothetical protein